MRIAYIATGAAGMYCGTCLHDNTLAAALIRKGHQVALVPTYTPIRTDEEDVSIHKIFYGGINVYLQQKSSLFRHTPRIFDRLLDSPSLLNKLSGLASSTDARELGELTVSVLKGEEGYQKKELERLITWLQEYEPELIHLNVAMFLGMAHEMKKRLNVPIVCALTGEDLFVQDLKEPYKADVRKLLQEKARHVEAFISPSNYYAEFMSGYLDVLPDRVHTVKLGLNLKGHGGQNQNLPAEPFVIGYLARICPEKGIHILADAFHQLAEKHGKEKLRLRIAGYLSKKDAEFFSQVRKQLQKQQLDDVVEYMGEVTRVQKIDFLNRIHVLSVPAPYKEPKGLYVLEALANGIPVIQPPHGAFPELIKATGGGILAKSGSPEDLAEAIETLMIDNEKRVALGKSGKESVHRLFTDEIMADETIQIYQKYITLHKSRKLSV
jgi:glycosyltransferase involved in cell wall biosynthesis